MKEELQNKVLEWAQKIEDTAPEVWKIAVKQVYVDLADLIAPLIATIVFVMVFNWSLDFGSEANWGATTDRWSNCNIIYYIISFATGIASFIFGGITLCEIAYGLKRVINPKYYAIWKLRNMVSK